MLILSIFFTLPILPVSGQFAADEPSAFAQAEKYYALGMNMADRYEKARYLDYAIGLYKNYLDRFPNSSNSATAYHHRGRSEQSIGRIDEAKRAYQLMIRKYQRGNSVGLSSLQMAWLAYTTEDWSAAADHFRLASTEITKDSVRQGALTKWIECLSKTNRTIEYRKALTDMVQNRRHPHRQWARFMLGYQYYKDEQFELTISTLKPLLEEGVSNSYRSQAMFYTGLAVTELGQNENGADYLLQVLALSTSKPGLTAEQRRQISHNKSLAQTALMKLAEKKGDHEEVLRLYTLGDFGARGKTEARRSMSAGKSFYFFKRYQNARSAFRRVDRSVPNTPLAFDASFYTLKCDFQMKQASLPDRVDAFLDLYQSSFSNHQNIHLANFLKAETLYDTGKFEKSSYAFSTIDPALLPAKLRQGLFYKRGWCYAEMGDNNRATHNFSRFLSEFPDDPRATEALAKRAESYFLLGDRHSALRDYEAVLNQNPNQDLNLFALQGSGRVLRAEKKYKLMVDRYRKILSESSEVPTDTIANANYWIGWGYFKEENYDDAKPYLQKSRELMPEFYNEPAGNLLVLLTFAQGDTTRMNEVLKSLLSDFPGKMIPSHMLKWLGLQLFHDGNFVDSVRFLERGTSPERPKRTDVFIWRTLAKGQNETGDYTSALATASIVLSLVTDPRWRADALLDMAQAQLGLQQYETAQKSAQEGLAIKTQGTHTAGLELVLGKIAYHQGDYENALASFEKSAQILVDDLVITPNALLLAAQSAEKLKDTSRAAAFRRRLTSQFPKWKAPAEQSPDE
ncbi:tetratricopeptide repeat protein [Akkermansiaceae bacterium]|nr:tetratricopeptide repeat protein [Akkermansiaceae bacterium]